MWHDWTGNRIERYIYWLIFEWISCQFIQQWYESLWKYDQFSDAHVNIHHLATQAAEHIYMYIALFNWLKGSTGCRDGKPPNHHKWSCTTHLVTLPHTCTLHTNIHKYTHTHTPCSNRSLKSSPARPKPMKIFLSEHASCGFLFLLQCNQRAKIKTYMQYYLCECARALTNIHSRTHGTQSLFAWLPAHQH